MQGTPALTQRQIQSIERGARPATANKYQKICNALKTILSCLCPRPSQRLNKRLPDNFGTYDKLYGLNSNPEGEAGVRQEVSAQLERAGTHKYITIDELNNATGVSVGNPRALEELAGDDAQTEEPRLWFSYLQNVKGQDFWQDNPNGDTSENKRIKAACKLGIDFTILLGGKIHFILDDIDTDAIARKENYNNDKTNTWIDVTGAELRYIYRNWSKLGKHVFFYKKDEDGNLNQVAAPWEKQSSKWRSYAWSQILSCFKVHQNWKKSEEAARRSTLDDLDSYSGGRKSALSLASEGV